MQPISIGGIFGRLAGSSYTAYAESRFNSDTETWVWSHTSRFIDYMSAQNYSYFKSSGNYAGSSFQESPSGWQVGAISAYVKVNVTPLGLVNGYHYFNTEGYNPISLDTSASR